MNLIAAAAWETRHAFRQLLPWRWARWLLVALVLALEAGLFVFVLFLAPPSPRPLEIGVVGGFVGFNLLLATGAAGLALSRLLGRPEALWLLSLSPTPPKTALKIALAPALLAALCPLTLVGLPFAVLAARRAPLVATSMLFAGACALGWAVLAAVACATFIGQRFGRERGARLLAAFSGWLAFLAMMAFGALVRRQLGTPALVMFLALTPLLLPVLWERALHGFIDVLQGTQTPRTAPEPAWGTPGWSRLALRSPWLLALLGLIPVMAVAFDQPELRTVLCALLAVQGVAVMLDRVLEPELMTPDRLRLAPRGAILRARLLFQWGTAALIPAAGLCLMVGWERKVWLLCVIGTSALVPFTYLAAHRTLRVAAQLTLLAGALAASLLWGR
ncbi:hypothetical protein [Myxococcus sp. Y35]|uniref:hypothetical protein n=1 Tax=Pseudomyxococcus flavus TaxID=3115648 RepID=UPI003CF36074